MEPQTNERASMDPDTDGQALMEQQTNDWSSMEPPTNGLPLLSLVSLFSLVTDKRASFDGAAKMGGL